MTVIVCMVGMLTQVDSPNTLQTNLVGLIFEDSAMWLIAQN